MTSRHPPTVAALLTRTRFPRALLGAVLLLVPLAAGCAPSSSPPQPAGMVLASPVMVAGGVLPVEFTCDGASHSPPLAWTGVPAGTESLALVMHHVPAPGDSHWYWVLYEIAPAVTHLDANATPPAVVGTNGVDDRTAYTPPCSQGPGPKTYTFTLYALSAAPTLPDPSMVSRQVLLDAIDHLVIATATLDVTYARAAPSAQGRTP